MADTPPLDDYDLLQEAATEAMEAFIRSVQAAYCGNRIGAIRHAIAMLKHEAPRREPKPLTRKAMSARVSRAVWDRDGWICQDCGTHVHLTVDHIIALANGGTEDFDNLQTLCWPCNSRKGSN